MSGNNHDVEKRTLIMKSARDLFFQFGLSKTSMEDIARQSGMAKPTLYYYYASKETIFNEVVIKEAQAFMDKVEKKLPKDAPADEKIAVFFRTVYQDLKVYAAKMEKVPVYMCEHSPHGRPIVEKINALFRAKLLPLLTSGKEEGSFEFEDVAITVSTLVFMTDFLNFDWMHHNPEKVRDQVVETMIEIILKGLKRRP
jgi:AcrR family transcriptional regulator